MYGRSWRAAARPSLSSCGTEAMCCCYNIMVSIKDIAFYFYQYFCYKIVLHNAARSVEARDGETVVTLERRGEGVLPVRAVVTRRDGSTETIEWDGRAEQQAFPL